MPVDKRNLARLSHFLRIDAKRHNRLAAIGMSINWLKYRMNLLTIAARDSSGKNLCLLAPDIPRTKKSMAGSMCARPSAFVQVVRSAFAGCFLVVRPKRKTTFVPPPRFMLFRIML
jgi:hypothetical protein